MKREETHKLLVQVSFLDNRVVDEGNVEMWHRTVGHADFETLEKAVPIAFAESDQYLTPHRLLAVGKRLKEDKAIERQRKDNAFEGDFVRAPDNLAEMVAVYAEMYASRPWKTDFVANNARTQLSGPALEQEIEKSFRSVGRSQPQPIWGTS